METAYGASPHYQDEAGKGYFEIQNRNAALGAKLDRLKFDRWIRPSDSVLDFGCGGGWLLKEIEATRKVGVELNPAAHPTCQSNGIEVYSRIADVPDRMFTRIISHHSLEHVPNPICALGELKQKLAPDGRLLLVLPIDDWRSQRDATGRDFDHHLFTWTPRLIANTLAEAGFRTESARILTHAWPRYWNHLYRVLPGPLFHLLCRLWAVVRRQRQLIVVACPNS